MNRALAYAKRVRHSVTSQILQLRGGAAFAAARDRCMNASMSRLISTRTCLSVYMSWPARTVARLLVRVAVIACLGPALRAARTDPNVALRAE